MSDRLAIHARALDLFRQGHDLDTARRIASSEQTPERSRDSTTLTRAAPPTHQEPAGPTAALPRRMVGFDRGAI